MIKIFKIGWEIKQRSKIWMIKNNIRPVIAHPERNKFAQKTPSIYTDLVNSGCMLQITAGSILGLFGATVKTISESLVDLNLAHIIASDAHNSHKRRPCMKECCEYLLETHSEQKIKNMSEILPGKICGIF